MAKPSVDQIVTQGQKRIYMQPGGARPNATVLYGGVDGQEMMLDSLSIPFGELESVWAPDPRRAKKFKRIARSAAPPDDITLSVTFLEQRGELPAVFRRQGCPFNFYEQTGFCGDLSDFDNGWRGGYQMIHSGAEPTNLDGGTRTSRDGDEQVENTVDFNVAESYPVGTISFNSVDSLAVSREIADITYGDARECGNCGPANDGAQWMYAVSKSSGSGSPGLPGEVHYSVDGGVTWTEIQITGIGASEDPRAVGVVGDKLVVLSRTAGGAASGGYYWATINQLTGVPGTFTKVITGFINLIPPNDMFVMSSREVFFPSNNGYIYKSTDITAGVTVISAGTATSQNLLRMHGQDDTIYATGANSTVIKSANRGRTWASTIGTVPTTTATIQAIAVLDEYRAWVGSSSGRMFYTLTGGETWVEQSVSGAAAIWDIVFPTDDCGYVACVSDPLSAFMLATTNGGASWSRNDAGPRLQNLPVIDRINRIAVPLNVYALTAANNIALAGLHGDGVDGLIVFGGATVR